MSGYNQFFRLQAKTLRRRSKNHIYKLFGESQLPGNGLMGVPKTDAFPPQFRPRGGNDGKNRGHVNENNIMTRYLPKNLQQKTQPVLIGRAQRHHINMVVMFLKLPYPADKRTKQLVLKINFLTNNKEVLHITTLPQKHSFR